MTAQTKKILKKLIRLYMVEHEIGYKDPCPFPISWRTVSSICSKKHIAVNTKTQRSLCRFFNLDYELDGRDVKIICKQQ